jgi:hypothetical protein
MARLVTAGGDMSKSSWNVRMAAGALLGALAGACAAQPAAPRTPSYAIYAEYAKDTNRLMRNGINQRVFNKVEAQSGTDIGLNPDGSISLEPGTYHLVGFSTTTMQTTMGPAAMKNQDTYPGYCVVYPKQFSADQEVLQHQIAIGTPQTASYLAPSLIDAYYTVDRRTEIMLGHQSGSDLHDEVYLSVYEVGGVKRSYSVFARLSITKM